MTAPGVPARPLVVYGVGAIGGVIAGQLRLAGFDVTAVARGEHLSAIRRHGLTLVTQAGTNSVALSTAAGAGDIDWSTDPVVILAVNSHQTASALEDLSAHAPTETPVFVAQNGVANEAAALREARFHSQVRDDVMAWKHRKLIANLGNGVIAAAGIPFVTAEQDALRRGDMLQGRVHDDYLSSTWQSVARGHTQVETDWFNGEIVLQARLHGLRAPVNELIQRVTAEHARVGRPVRSLDATAALRKLGPLPRQPWSTQPADV
ncbi:2-dehydropantoate 2-reductase N-terminal domain-containing protein [Mycolicibacterium boenickei]